MKLTLQKITSACCAFGILISACNNKDWYPEIGPPLNSYVKYINAIPQSNLDFYAYYTRMIRGVGYGKDQKYTNSPIGNIVLSATNANETTNRAIATTSAATAQMNGQGLVPEYYHTVFACKRSDSTDNDELILLRDNLTSPPAGLAHIRFVYLTQRGKSKIKTVDLKSSNGEGYKVLFTAQKYRVPSNAVLIDASKGLNTQGIGVFTSGPFSPISAGNYDFDMVEAGGAASLASKSSVKIEAGKIYTIYSCGKIGEEAMPPALNMLIHN